VVTAGKTPLQDTCWLMSDSVLDEWYFVYGYG